jgi:hypothetical protein
LIVGDNIVDKRDINMKKIFIWLILFYRKYLSPLKSTKCPYYPTCSTYGLEAVQKYGAFRGGLLAIWRIFRCNPFSRGGYDPVPSTIKGKKKFKTFYKL